MGGSPTSVQHAPSYQPAQESLHCILTQWRSRAISVNQPISISPNCPIVLQWELPALFAVQKQTISLLILQMTSSGSARPWTIFDACSLQHPRGSAMMQSLASLSGL